MLHGAAAFGRRALNKLWGFNTYGPSPSAALLIALLALGGIGIVDWLTTYELRVDAKITTLWQSYFSH